MQDFVQEITALLDPSEPLGYRLLIFGGSGCGTVMFEAKAVRFKHGVAFLVRTINSREEGRSIPALNALTTMFAPTEDALKFLIRRVYEFGSLYQRMLAVLKLPIDIGHSRNYDYGAMNVELHKDCYLNRDDHDSCQERRLRETIAALTLMRVPVGLKW